MHSTSQSNLLFLTLLFASTLTIFVSTSPINSPPPGVTPSVANPFAINIPGLNDVEPNEFSYTVPNTNIRLEGSYAPDDIWRLVPRLTDAALLKIKQRMISHIAEHGDGPLLPADDPVRMPIERIDRPEFLWFDIHIKSWEGKLTYGNVRDTVVGMKNVYFWKSAYHDVQAEIVVGTRKRVGQYETYLKGPPDLGCGQKSTVGLGASGCLKNNSTASQ